MHAIDATSSAPPNRWGFQVGAQEMVKECNYTRSLSLNCVCVFVCVYAELELFVTRGQEKVAYLSNNYASPI